MSETPASLQRKISSAGDLQAVVRTMKALAASSIGQYERSVSALAEYYRTVELDLSVCFRESEPAAPMLKARGKIDSGAIGAIVFGSDQGLVGQFNDVVANFAIETLGTMASKPQVWAIGERVQAHLIDAGLSVAGFSRFQTRLRQSPALWGKFKLKAKRIGQKASMRTFMSSTIDCYQEQDMSQSVSGYCRSTHNGSRSGGGPLANKDLT